MSEDKIIAADDALLQERAKLLAELSDITKAADEVTRLREENARLRETLTPFVAENIQAFAHAPDSDICFVRCVVTFGDMRAAAAAIREGEKDE